MNKTNTKDWIVYLLPLLVVAATLGSCSSKDSAGEDGAPAVEEVSGDAAANGDASQPAGDLNAPNDSMAANGDQPAAQAETPVAPAETTPQEVAANELGDNPNNPNAAPVDGKDKPADQAATDPNAAPPPTDGATDLAGNTTPPPDAATPPADAPATPADAGGTGGDLFGAAAMGGGDVGAAPVEEPKKKSGGGKLAHIKAAPFKKGGQLLNTVYIARDGDTLDSISQKIFGDDQTKMLKKANPTLKSSVKVGDKVYFNSPNRPDDKERLITVYEDQGLPSSTYTTKEGDTLKSLAQEWYGNEQSYKEIYAINRNLASTKELPAGTELQYWPGSVSVASYGMKKEPEVAQAPPPPMPPPSAPAPASNMPPIPPPSMAANNMPPAGAGTMNNMNGAPPPGMNPPPPPMPDLNAAPPPPPPAPMRKPKKDMGGNMDKDMVFNLFAAGAVVIGVLALVMIRRRNSRRNSGATQV